MNNSQPINNLIDWLSIKTIICPFNTFYITIYMNEKEAGSRMNFQDLSLYSLIKSDL